MYTKILVPLDGSKTAESVLPHLQTVAKGCGTQEVILLSVTEALSGYTQKVEPFNAAGIMSSSIVSPNVLPPRDPVMHVPHATGKKLQQATKYLARIAKRLRAEEFMVRIEVLVGSPAQEIIKYAQENNGDLIVMSSHGRTGIDRWAHSIGAYGGVADKVLRASPIPVLVVKAV